MADDPARRFSRARRANTGIRDRRARHWRWFALVGSLQLTAVCAQPVSHGAISLLVPYPPGGVSDVLARAFAPALSRTTGQPVVVDNLSGASGSIAASRFLAGRPDATQLLVGSPAETILAPLTIKAVRYRAVDFTLLGIVYQAPLALYARPGLEARTVDELAALAERPGDRPLSYGSTGQGSLYHVVTENLRKTMGIEALHVPYRGGAPLLQDLMAGTVDFTMLPQDRVLEGLVDGGKLRLLGVATRNRSVRYPSVQTFDESARAARLGHPAVWVGLFVPRAMPAETTRQLHRAVSEALAQAQTRQALEAGAGGGAATMKLDDAQAFFRQETERLEAMARNANVQPD